MNNNIYTVVQDTHIHTQGKHKHRHTHTLTQGTHKHIYTEQRLTSSFVYLPIHLSRRCLLRLPIEPSPHQVCPF